MCNSDGSTDVVTLRAPNDIAATAQARQGKPVLATSVQYVARVVAN